MLHSIQGWFLSGLGSLIVLLVDQGVFSSLSHHREEEKNGEVYSSDCG